MNAFSTNQTTFAGIFALILIVIQEFKVLPISTAQETQRRMERAFCYEADLFIDTVISGIHKHANAVKCSGNWRTTTFRCRYRFVETKGDRLTRFPWIYNEDSPFCGAYACGGGVIFHSPTNFVFLDNGAIIFCTIDAQLFRKTFIGISERCNYSNYAKLIVSESGVLLILLNSEATYFTTANIYQRRNLWRSNNRQSRIAWKNSKNIINSCLLVKRINSFIL